MIFFYNIFQLTLLQINVNINVGEIMNKGFKLIDIIVVLIIVILIGIVATIIVFSVIKDIKKDGDKIVLDNYANKVIYTIELFEKNNDNNIPKYCINIDNKIFYDENYNNKYDSNELECNKDCNSDNCIKYFITSDDINDKNIKCNKIIINDDNSINISNCFVNNKEIKNYVYNK